MAMKIDSDLLVYTFTKEENETLKNILTYYVLKNNSDRSQELGRDLKDNEKFSASREFAEILKMFDVDQTHWRIII